MQNLRQLKIILIALTAALFCRCAMAQSNLTQVRDTIYNADGTPFNGTIVITFNGNASTLTGTVSPLSTSARIYNGALSVLLVPTTTAGGNSFYQIVYTSSDGTTRWTETWQVPPSSNALSVSGVRTSTSTGGGGGTGTTGTTGTTPPASATQYATLPIAMSQVTGLNSAINTLTTSNTANTTAISAAQSSISTLQSTATAHTNAISTLESAATAQANLISSLQSASTTQASAISSLQSTASTQGNALSSLQTTVNALSTTVAGLSGSSSSPASGVGFVDAEVPGGSLNGTNAVFSLASTPSPAGSLTLYRNGLLQRPTTDYALSGNGITFTSNAIPRSTDALEAFYRIVGSGTLPAFTDGEVPAGAINGTNATFTLTATPNPAKSVELFKNGVLQVQGSDYAISGATVTFNGTAIPQSGDALTASYRH